MSTPQQVEQLRTTLMGFTAKATAAIEALMAHDSRQSTFAEHFTTFVEPYVEAAALYSSHWYDQLAPTSRYESTPNAGVSDVRIQRTIGWAFGAPGDESPTDRLIGTTQRMIFDASRTTVVTAAEDEGVPWHRDARAEACSFCRYMTVKPDGYQAKYAVMPSHNHDCQCVAVASRRGNPYTVPEHVLQWRAQVRHDESGDLTATLAKMSDLTV